MRIHLVSYATPKFRHRQLLLAASGKANGIIQSVTSWTSSELAKSKFPSLAPDISLNERGSGFWAWKPFIILQLLQAVPDGDIVLYSDVGRKFPYILLDHPLGGFIEWMDKHHQDIMPGVIVPWNGSMENWTKQDAFICTGVDNKEIRRSPQIQASFSLWRNNSTTRALVAEWQSWCLQRQLISDDPSIAPNSKNFKAHRHDQSLLNLCCYKHQIQAMDIGLTEPSYNERDPARLAKEFFKAHMKQTFKGQIIKAFTAPSQAIEKLTRNSIQVGKRYE